jgi:hypothetical protein
MPRRMHRLHMQQKLVTAAPALGQRAAQLAGFQEGAGKQHAVSGRLRQQGRGQAMLRRMADLRRLRMLQQRLIRAAHAPGQRTSQLAGMHTGKGKQHAG